MPERSSISNTAAEISREILEFIQTRFHLLRSEIKENLGAWKMASLAIAVALLFLITTFVLVTGALTALVAAWLPTHYRWVLASFIIAVIYAGLGGGFAYYGLKRWREAPLVPKKTIDVLREDKQWLEGGGKAA
jgi:uncharacterized membrane protein YqjE